MRKATLAIGVIYLLWSTLMFITINKLVELYENFNGRLPTHPYLLSTIIFVSGLTLVFGYLANFRNISLYKNLIVAGVLGFAVYFLSLFYYDYKASIEIYKVINGY